MPEDGDDAWLKGLAYDFVTAPNGDGYFFIGLPNGEAASVSFRSIALKPLNDAYDALGREFRLPIIEAPWPIEVRGSWRINSTEDTPAYAYVEADHVLPGQAWTSCLVGVYDPLPLRPDGKLSPINLNDFPDGELPSDLVCTLPEIEVDSGESKTPYKFSSKLSAEAQLVKISIEPKVMGDYINRTSGSLPGDSEVAIRGRLNTIPDPNSSGPHAWKHREIEVESMVPFVKMDPDPIITVEKAHKKDTAASLVCKTADGQPIIVMADSPDVLAQIDGIQGISEGIPTGVVAEGLYHVQVVKKSDGLMGLAVVLHASDIRPAFGLNTTYGR
jgi:hypothetical protein